MPFDSYILDFDGVICHSAVETGYVAWQCARRHWPNDFAAEEIPDRWTRGFLAVRPYLEYGAEAILMLKLLVDGWQPEEFPGKFVGHSAEIMDEYGLSRDALVKEFGAARDALIKDNLSFWLGLNHCYHQSIITLKHWLQEKRNLLILTTKQERFVTAILEAEGIVLPPAALCGMEAGRKKKDVVAEFADRYSSVCYVEDRLEALQSIPENLWSDGVRLFMADWGYATAEQLELAKNNSRQFKVISALSEIDE